MVLSTLVSSARDVYRLMAAEQLRDAASPGISNSALQRLVLERFVLNSAQVCVCVRVLCRVCL
jgi:hypothetical protein